MTLTFDDTQAAALLEAQGLPADTDDPHLVMATAVDLATKAAGTEPAKPSEVAAAARRHGMEVIDHDTAEALRRDAAEGRKLAAAAAHQKIEASVDDAIRKGKITPARRKHWINVIGADPGMADVLAFVPNETAVPLTEVGHSVSAENGGNDFAESATWFH
jgi:hypothetical protein